MRIRSLVSCALLAPFLTAASQPVRLQPSSGWVLDYAQDSCRLIRTFGEGSQQVKLAFESEAPRQIDMLVVGKPLSNDTNWVGARFLPMQTKAWFGRSAQATGNGDPAILWSDVAMLPEDFAAELRKEADKHKVSASTRPAGRDLAKEALLDAKRLELAAATTELEMLTRLGHPVRLETGSLRAPMQALDKCGRDSLADWGVDANLEDKIVKPVWTPTEAWLTSDDYPAALIDQDQESDVKVRLLVDAAGNVTKCTSLSYFKAPEFNTITCRAILQRAHFQPAELADGTKVPSYFTRKIKFRIAN